MCAKHCLRPSPSLCSAPCGLFSECKIACHSVHYTTLFFSWWFQGLIFTGLWVIGHEVSFSLDALCRVNLFLKCGHGAFSDYEIINDTIGFVSWRMHYLQTLITCVRLFTQYCGRRILAGRYPITGTTQIMRQWSAMKFTCRKRGQISVSLTKDQERSTTMKYLAIRLYIHYTCLFDNSFWLSQRIFVST